MNISEMKQKLIWPIRFSKVKLQVKKNKGDLIFLVGTPLHGNLGDHAIAKESIRFIQENTEAKVIEIPSPVIGRNVENFKKIIGDSIIVITGGGFMGSLWGNEEAMVQEVVKHFPQNKIVFFPQTLFFEETKKGDELKEKAKKIYYGDNLYFVAREERTYQVAQNVFKHVIFAPDIVARMKVLDEYEKREGCLFCMRKDKEKTLQVEQWKMIKNKIVPHYSKIKEIDTVIPIRVTDKKREYELNQILTQFQKHELVVTDRLHGMIFATITKTPCIVFNNSSSKVKGVYKYLQKYTNYVFLCEEQEKIEELIKKVKEIHEIQFKQDQLEKEYQDLKEIIKEEK